jgi:hypothetical protein
MYFYFPDTLVNSKPCISCDIVDGNVTGGSEFVSSRTVKNFSSFLFAKSKVIGAPEWRVGEFRVLDLKEVVHFGGGVCCNADRFNEDFQG